MPISYADVVDQPLRSTVRDSHYAARKIIGHAEHTRLPAQIINMLNDSMSKAQEAAPTEAAFSLDILDTYGRFVNGIRLRADKEMRYFSSL